VQHTDTIWGGDIALGAGRQLPVYVNQDRKKIVTNKGAVGGGSEKLRKGEVKGRRIWGPRLPQALLHRASLLSKKNPL